MSECDCEAKGKPCTCAARRRAFFAKQNGKPKKVNDLLPEAHKHVYTFLQTVGKKEWHLCDCGDIMKLED